MGKLRQIILVDAHERNIIGIVGAFLGQSIGRHLHHLAANDRGDALLVARAKQSVGCGTHPRATRYWRETECSEKLRLRLRRQVGGCRRSGGDRSERRVFLTRIVTYCCGCR